MGYSNHKKGTISNGCFSRMCQDDREAFTQLYWAYYDKLYAFLLGLTHSQAKAEDIVQDVFVTLWHKREDFGDIENVNALLFKMAQNRAINVLRQSSRELLALSGCLDTETYTSANEPLGLLLEKELRNKISEAIDQLPAQQKKVYKLHKEQGVPHNEIAQTLNLSLSTIHSHMNLALSNIHKYLTAKYPDLLIYIATILLLK